MFLRGGAGTANVAFGVTSKKIPNGKKRNRHFLFVFLNAENLQPFQLESHCMTSRPAISAQTCLGGQKI